MIIYDWQIRLILALLAKNGVQATRESVLAFLQAVGPK